MAAPTRLPFRATSVEPSQIVGQYRRDEAREIDPVQVDYWRTYLSDERRPMPPIIVARLSPDECTGPESRAWGLIDGRHRLLALAILGREGPVNALEAPYDISQQEIETIQNWAILGGKRVSVPAEAHAIFRLLRSVSDDEARRDVEARSLAAYLDLGERALRRRRQLGARLDEVIEEGEARNPDEAFRALQARSVRLAAPSQVAELVC